MTPTDLRRILQALPTGDSAAAAAVVARQATLTKPPGSLGRLETLVAWLARWQGRAMPRLDTVRVLVFAGNHGVTARGVSPYPAAVTAQMVGNFAAGGAAINQLAKAAGAELQVVPLDLDRPTADITRAPAMTEAEFAAALTTGHDAVQPGTDLLCLGEMGIGNTTAAAALCAGLFGGDGFKAPSLYELFSQYRNPTGLSPETSHGWEAGVDQSVLDGRLHGTLTYFERHTDDLIDFQSCYVAVPPTQCANPETASAGGFYYNIGRSRASGIEAQIAANITDTITATVNYTNLTAKDLVADDTLPREPRNRASAILTWAPETDWSVGGSVSYTAREIDQYDTSTSPPTAFVNGGHTLVDLFGQYSFDNWSLYARVENVLGQHYEPLLGYGAPGRAVYAGIRVNE